MTNRPPRSRRRPQRLVCDDGLGTASDVKVNVEDGEYSCVLLTHKHVLRRSTWFENCLQENTWKEGYDNVITLPETADYAIIMINYLYNNNVRFEDIEEIAAWHLGLDLNTAKMHQGKTFSIEVLGIIIDLWDLADRYCMYDLRDSIEPFYQQPLSGRSMWQRDIWKSWYGGLQHWDMHYYYADHEHPRFAAFIARLYLEKRYFRESDHFNQAIEDFPWLTSSVLKILMEEWKLMPLESHETAVDFIIDVKGIGAGPFDGE